MALPRLNCDKRLGDHIFNALREINRQGKKLVLVEENASLAFDICHHAYVLESGRVVMSGTGAELLGSEEIIRAHLG